MEIGPLQNSSGNMPESISGLSQKENLPERKNPQDSVFISENAREKLEKLADAALKKYGLGEMPSSKTVTNDPEIRIDKIKLAKERIESGYYKQFNIVEQIADKLADEINGTIDEEKDQG